MPQPEATRKPSELTRKFPWIGIAAAALVVCAVGYFAMKRSAPAPTEPVAAPAPAPAAATFAPRHLYSETANPTADIKAALAQAKKEHKRVLVDFGGDWCGDCQVLDIYMHQPPNDQLVENNYVVVHVWIGHIDEHLDVPEKYGVPIHKGVPELVVLTPDDKVVYAQKGEFENMRHVEAASLTEFLEKWKS